MVQMIYRRRGMCLICIEDICELRTHGLIGVKTRRTLTLPPNPPSALISLRELGIEWGLLRAKRESRQRRSFLRITDNIRPFGWGHGWKQFHIVAIDPEQRLGRPRGARSRAPTTAVDQRLGLVHVCGRRRVENDDNIERGRN